MRLRFDRKKLIAHYTGLWAQAGATGDLFQGSGREDANEALAFARELEHFIGDVYELDFTDLPALSLFPADPSTADPADRTFTTRHMTASGKAIPIADWTTELPSVQYDALGENTYPIRSYGNQYILTVQDMRTAAKLGRSLETKLAETAKRAHAEVFEACAFFGDDVSKVTGLFDSAAFVANETAKVGVAWDNVAATPAIILNDFGNLWKKVCVDTNWRYVPDTFAVAPAAFEILSRVRDFGSGMFGSMSEVLLRTYGPQGLKSIVQVPALAAVPAPVSAAVGILYSKRPEVVAHQTPIFFEQHLPQVQGFALRVPCHSRIGGVHVEKPKGLTWMKGILT
jgi:hypothetical protein